MKTYIQECYVWTVIYILCGCLLFYVVVYYTLVKSVLFVYSFNNYLKFDKMESVVESNLYYLLSITIMLPVSLHYVIIMLPLCYHYVTIIFPLCYYYVTIMFPLCYHYVTIMLPLCYHYVSIMFPLCYHYVSYRLSKPPPRFEPILFTIMLFDIYLTMLPPTPIILKFMVIKIEYTVLKMKGGIQIHNFKICSVPFIDSNCKGNFSLYIYLNLDIFYKLKDFANI